MLYVNTIEFNGQKAVLNSYSPQFIDILGAGMEAQRDEWAARYPNATVKTERMSEVDTMALVAAGRLGPLRNWAYEIGQASNR